MLRRLALFCTVLTIASCANEEQEQMLAQLQTDLTSANAAIDSLTYTLDDSNLLLDALRAKADSAQSVNENISIGLSGGWHIYMEKRIQSWFAERIEPLLQVERELAVRKVPVTRS